MLPSPQGCLPRDGGPAQNGNPALYTAADPQLRAKSRRLCRLSDRRLKLRALRLWRKNLAPRFLRGDLFPLAAAWLKDPKRVA